MRFYDNALLGQCASATMSQKRRQWFRSTCRRSALSQKRIGAEAAWRRISTLHTTNVAIAQLSCLFVWFRFMDFSYGLAVHIMQPCRVASCRASAIQQRHLIAWHTLRRVKLVAWLKLDWFDFLSICCVRA